MLTVLVAGILFLGAVLWLLLERHEKRRAANGKSRHSRLRLILAAAALLAMMSIGALSLLLLLSISGNSGTPAVPATLITGGPLFLIGFLVWWLAMRRDSR